MSYKVMLCLWLGILVIGMSLGACRSEGIAVRPTETESAIATLTNPVTRAPETRARPTETMPIAPASPSARADITITFPPNLQTITAQVGQTIRVAVPLSNQMWQVSFDSEHLVPLTDAESLRNPGPAGWFFQVKTNDTSDLMFTTIPEPCSTQTPCSPNAARFTVTVQVGK